MACPGMLCGSCADAVEWIGSACRCCGMPVLLAGDGPGCEACRGRRLAVDRIVAAGVHGGVLRRLVLLYKYQGERNLVRYLAGVLEKSWRTRLREVVESGGLAVSEPATEPEALLSGCGLVPVPGRRLGVLLRGRDPVLELTTVLAARLDLPVLRILKRRRRARPQVGLPREHRLRNQVNVFAVRRRADIPSTAIIVDDVVTTCATVNDAARALRKVGVRRVFVLAVGRSGG